MSEDILVYAPDGKLVVLAQVRAYRETSIQWATEILPDILFDEEQPPYLVLVTRDQTYFWQAPAEHPVPAFAVATDDLLRKHLERLRTSAADIDYGVLGMILFDWIADATRDVFSVPEFLRGIGFIDAIRAGRVEYQTAA
jgi:hypothetical protein